MDVQPVCTHVCSVCVHVQCTHTCNQCLTHMCSVCNQCLYMCVQCVCTCMCNQHTHMRSVCTHVCSVCNQRLYMCAIGVCTHVYNLFHTKESMLTPLPHLMYWKLFHCSTRRASSLFEMGKWQPTPVLVPRKSHGWRSLVQATVHGVAKSRTRLGDFTKLTKYILLFDCPMFTEAAHGRGLDYRH